MERVGARSQKEKNMRNFKALIKLANTEIVKVKEMLEENKAIFENRNMKLTRAFYNDELQEKYALTDDDYDSYFYRFCEDAYDQFKEWLNEEKIDEDMLHYVGHTSTFHLRPEHDIVSFDRYNRFMFEDCIGSYIRDFIGSNSDLDYVLGVDGCFNTRRLTRELSSIGNTYFNPPSIETVTRNLKEDMIYLTENIVKDFKEELADVVRVYHYLEDFQNNQEQYFEEYLKTYIEEIA